MKNMTASVKLLNGFEKTKRGEENFLFSFFSFNSALPLIRCTAIAANALALDEVGFFGVGLCDCKANFAKLLL